MADARMMGEGSVGGGSAKNVKEGKERRSRRRFPNKW